MAREYTVRTKEEKLAIVKRNLAGETCGVQCFAVWRLFGVWSADVDCPSDSIFWNIEPLRNAADGLSLGIGLPELLLCWFG